MITSYIFTGAILVISLIMQGHTSFEVLSIGGVRPDLVFIAVIYFSYSFGSFYGEVTGFLSGLLHDAVSNSPLGLMAFPKMVLGYLIGLFGKSILKENILTIFAMVFFASVVKGVITLLLCYLFHKQYISAIINIILPESFYNALLAPPLFFLYNKIFEDVIPREKN